MDSEGLLLPEPERSEDGLVVELKETRGHRRRQVRVRDDVPRRGHERVARLPRERRVADAALPAPFDNAIRSQALRSTDAAAQSAATRFGPSRFASISARSAFAISSSADAASAGRAATPKHAVTAPGANGCFSMTPRMRSE